MTEAEWLASEDPQAMLDDVTKRIKPGHDYRISDRKLRLFACSCGGWARAWRCWYDKTHDKPGYFSSLDGALFAAGVKVGQADPGRFHPDEMARRANILRDIVGNPWRPVAPLTRTVRWVRGEGVLHGNADWLTPTVLSLAHAAYDDRRPDGTLDPERLVVLSDALEDAGCDNEEILRHLRGEEPRFRETFPPGGQMLPMPKVWKRAGWKPLSGPHVRGCWVIDLLTGRE